MNEIDLPPRDFTALRLRIGERAADLPKRLAQIAAFALDHPDDIAFGTVASIAAQADVQPSTLVRFAQALGYQGFSELQEVFRSRLRDRILTYDERLAQLREHAVAASKSTTLLQGFTEAAEMSLAGLREKVEPAALERAVTVLAGAKTIYLLGLRRSFPVTFYLSYAFSKLNVRAVLVDAMGGLGLEQSIAATSADAMLAITFTPYASETVALARAAHARQVPIVVITDGPFSPLTQIAQVALEVSEANFEGFRSMAATFTLAMTLAVAIAERRAV